MRCFRPCNVDLVIFSGVETGRTQLLHPMNGGIGYCHVFWDTKRLHPETEVRSRLANARRAHTRLRRRARGLRAEDHRGARSLGVRFWHGCGPRAATRRSPQRSRKADLPERALVQVERLSVCVEWPQWPLPPRHFAFAERGHRQADGRHWRFLPAPLRQARGRPLSWRRR